MGAETSASVTEVLERAHKQSVRVAPADQARFVQDTLGSRLAAGALGLRDTRTLSSWARGGPIRGTDSEHRLQVLFRVVTAVSDAYTPAVAAAFLRGSNPTLNDRAPMVVLADQTPTDAEGQLLSAVEALLTA